MIESIKITALQNIGSNLSYTSVFPVVDLSGTPVTDKANLQIIGNYILSQAGGANMVQAAQSTLAQSVVNAAQPNITSVGTLTSLNLSGNLTIPVEYLKVSGGTNGYVLQTDGNGNLTWTAQTGGGGNGSPGGANTQIQFNDAGSFGGDAGLTFNKTTDTLTTGNISASNVELTGNVSANWVIGDYVSGNAHNLFYIPGANVNGTVPSATIAGTVTTAVQPNITSVGTLSNLSVTGNVTANYFVGVATDVSVGAVNNNYSYHMAFVTDSGDTTLHMDADDNLQYNPADGTMTVTRVDSGYLSVTQSVLSNLNPFSNVTQDLGNTTNRWKDIWLANSTIHMGDATISANGNSIVVDSITVTNGNVGTVGNVASLNLDGSSSNVLYGNGVFAPVSGGGGGLPLANGNSNFDIAAADGNATITSNGTYTWTFDDTGLITLPSGNTKIGSVLGGDAILANNAVFGVISQGNSGAAVVQWSDDISNTSLLSAVYVNGPFGNVGDIQVRTGDVATPNVWTFGNDGSVIFPTLTVDLHNGGNQQAQTLQFGDPTQQAIITGPTPAPDTAAQRLIIQGQRGNGLGEGGDVYLWAGDAEFNGGDIKIYAGDADDLTAGSGGYINLDGGSGFNGGGQINITGGYSSNGQGGATSLSGGQGGADGGAVSINGGGGSTAQGGNIALQGGYGGNNGGEVRLTGGSAGTGIPGYGNVVLVSGASTWTFDNNGNLVLAGGNSVIQSIANSSLDPLNPNVSTMTLTPDANYNSQILVLDPTAPGHIHLRAYCFSNIDEPAANIFLGGENTAFEITQGANNVAKIHSGSNTWTFGTDGNLVTPGLTGTYIKSAPGGYMGLAAMDDGGDQPAQLVSINSNSGLGTTAISAYANNALIQANINGDIKSWNFDNTGNLTLPGNTFAVNYANGTAVSLGGGLPLANGTSNIDIATSNGNVTITANGTSTWTFDTAGNLNTPGSLLPSSNGNYDLGSNANRWRDLYLSGNTIYLGPNVTLQSSDDDLLLGTPNIDLTFGGGAFTMANSANANNTFSIALFDDGADILVNGNVGGNLTFGGGAFVAETSQIIGNVVTSNTANIKNALINISLDVDANAAINFKDANGNIGANILLADDDILINSGNIGDLIFKGGAFTIANISNANNAFSIALFDDGADILVNGNQGNLTFGGGAFVMAANASIGFADANGNIAGNILLADDDILINSGPGGNLVFTGGAFVANTTDLRIGNTPSAIVVPVGVPSPVATKFSVVDGTFQQGNGDMWTDGFLYAANGIYTGANISANNIGNISGINLDGSNSNVLYGNGVFAPGGGGSYGDSNVVTLLGAFGSNAISTTGNISGGNVLASGTSSTVVRRAFGLVAADTAVTLDDLTVTVSSATNQLTLSTSGSWQGTGWTETFAGGGTPTVNSWVNLPLNPGFNNASGAMNSQGNGCRCVISDQTPSAKVYQITVVRSGTSGAQWNISIERLV